VLFRTLICTVLAAALELSAAGAAEQKVFTGFLCGSEPQVRKLAAYAAKQPFTRDLLAQVNQGEKSPCQYASVSFDEKQSLGEISVRQTNDTAVMRIRVIAVHAVKMIATSTGIVIVETWTPIAPESRYVLVPAEGQRA